MKQEETNALLSKYGSKFHVYAIPEVRSKLSGLEFDESEQILRKLKKPSTA